jgi:hypothetical protein
MFKKKFASFQMDFTYNIMLADFEFFIIVDIPV